MIHEYAMGTSITSRKISAHGGEVSDRTRELRDDEQQHLADEAKRAATRLIFEHRDKLDEMAAALLRNEVLERPDIDRIMAGTPRFRRGAGRPARRRRGRRDSADHERVGVALDGHALEAAVADLAVGVELGAGGQVDLDHVRRGGGSTPRCSAIVPRLRPHARRASPSREPAGRTATSSTPSAGIGGADRGAAAERAGDGDDHLPGRRRRTPSAPSARTVQGSGAAVAAARSAPTA